jgi:hypothetical protein
MPGSSAGMTSVFACTPTSFSNSGILCSHSFAISRPDVPEVCQKFPRPSNQRAQGMPGARCARSRVCKGSGGRHTRLSGHTGIARHSPRNGFNGFLRAPRRPGAFATVACGLASANLTPASGCQDHTTSPSASAPFVKSASASTASHPAAVTIACRPSVGRDAKSSRCDLGIVKTEIFLRKGLDTKIAEQPVGQISRPVRRSSKGGRCNLPLYHR